MSKPKNPTGTGGRDDVAALLASIESEHGVAATTLQTAALLAFLFDRCGCPDSPEPIALDRSWIELAKRVDAGEVALADIPEMRIAAALDQFQQRARSHYGPPPATVAPARIWNAQADTIATQATAWAVAVGHHGGEVPALLNAVGRCLKG